MNLRLFPPGSLFKGARKEPRKPPREGNSNAHLDLIRRLPCCVCGKEPAGTAHHLKSGEASAERGVGMRASDQWAVPLCANEHLLDKDRVEATGSKFEILWFHSRGVDALILARELWKATGNLPQMRWIVVSHRLEKADG